MMGEMPVDMAGEMSFLPKFSRLLDTLLMLRGAFALELDLERKKKENCLYHTVILALMSVLTLFLEYFISTVTNILFKLSLHTQK